MPTQETTQLLNGIEGAPLRQRLRLRLRYWPARTVEQGSAPGGTSAPGQLSECWPVALARQRGKPELHLAGQTQAALAVHIDNHRIQ